MLEYRFLAAAIRLSLAAAIVAIVPGLASAQTIAGVVRDASGGVLPGVTVEASSPALIEKVRSAVTDGSGQFRLDTLVAGVYSVTYALPGFSTVKRDGVQVQTGVTLTLNAELRLGGLQETITVTGETPVVDVQNSTRVQQVLSDEVLASLPASRGYGNLLAVSSGIQSNGTQSGGTNPGMIFFTSRGGRSNEGTVQIDGMNVGSAFNGGGVAGFGYDTVNAQEVQLTVAGGLGEADRGGPQFNIVPKSGGNNFAGTFFSNLAGSWSQSNNVDDELRSFGIPSPTKIIRNWDTSISVGGPIKRDRVWFYGTARTFGEYTDIAGRFGNLNAGNPARWDYIADQSITSRTSNSRKSVAGRVTAQLSERNKVSASFDKQFVCAGSTYTVEGEGCRVRGDDWMGVYGFGTWSPESTMSQDGRDHVMQFSYTAPVTNKLLLEAAASQFLSNWNPTAPAGALNQEPFIPVQEQSIAGGVPVPNMVYHGYAGLNNNYQTHNVWRASASYVTGAHSMKVGYQGAYEVTDIFGDFADHGLQYRFLGGVPNQITQRITPWRQANRTRWDAFYVQDQWTRNRLTLQGALRYEKAWSFFPEGLNGLQGDSRFGGPKRTLASAEGVTGYQDVAPRMGLAYDVFGDGKTAIKANLAKYWQYAANDGVYIGTNPAATFAQTANRSWNDANRDFVPQCDLNVAAGGGECGGLSNAAFFGFRDTGSVASTATVVSPDLLSGWNVRPYDWQFAASVQQQVLPRMSVEFGYSRRSWGNFTFTDNRAIGPADFDQYRFTVPTHPDLPTSGQTLSYLMLKPTAFGRVDNYLAPASDYADPTFYWQGVEMTVNARMNNGLTLQGGFTTGGGVRDLCEVAAQLPELHQAGGLLGNRDVAACRVEEPWLWAWRGLANYVVPKIDVQVSGIMRSMANVTATNDPASNGLSQSANYFEPAANIVAQLGRPVAGNASQVTLDLARLGDVYPSRINNVDMRVAKIVRFGRFRANVGFDLYNLFNANTGTAFNQNFGTNGATWLRPNAILNPRYARFNATVDF
ncbi:MAG TPA: carboxypeptidase regulatory-like domain-containing protein [Vicinamibacterales bacterium]